MSEAFKGEIVEAIGAHGMWKMRLKTAAKSGERNLPAGDICRDDMCKFGKWLKTVPGDGPHLGRVRQLHTQFHKAAGDIAGLINSGKADSALTALEGGAFKDSSSALVRELTDWKRKLT